MDFDSISSNIDEVLLDNPSADVFAFGDFNFHLRLNYYDTLNPYLFG